MSSFACRSLRITLLALLCCSGSGEKAFEVHVSSERQIVEATGALKVNCSTSCENPQVGGLETTLSKKVLEEHPQGKWKQFLVLNISQDTSLLCHFTCEEKQHSEHLNIRVYKPPAKVTLKLQSSQVFVGEAFTIECTAEAVKPLESLTLSLLHEGETLQNQTFGGAESNAIAIFNRTALTKDSLNLSCQAVLDLRPHGGHIILINSTSQILEVFEHTNGHPIIIIIIVVSILLVLFVTSVLLCFILGQHWHRKRTGTYGVLAAWMRLPRALRQRPG
ncbi:intercellular adhesion molecule 2 [Chionomys nivalis]|uniref:intercellular adhesion molecule 2 n=1 Tax=Chionomys nivalis TaxID=269649 RepID=UPI002597EB83|nr:intercellular adhesion molecule 2 [Chionomys nivalis]XP_057630815.1 intercellular adhesion molecule 2 [Chionomys nivalis]XP_057630816.1 intercellular adhesion molecule 2 [Chionomys nivalis]XP_057630817.1 intercellular adhesion molecule 2 [Chionomys nivalis]